MIDYFVENVRGVIIGETSRRVALVAPNGNVQRQTDLALNDDPKEWGDKTKKELLSVKCGDGKPLSFYPEIAASIYGAGEWSLKIFN